MNTEAQAIRVLAVDDNQAALDTVQDRLNAVSEDSGSKFAVTTCTSFSQAQQQFSTGAFDLAILDIRQDMEGMVPENGRGIDLFEKLKDWAFVPTIFYTAYANDLDEQISGLRFVRAVSKDQPVNLDAAVADLISSGAVIAARDVAQAVRSELRDFMWSQMADSVELLEDEMRSQLFRRSSARLDRFSPDSSDGVAPSRMYLIPPMSSDLECGAILREGDDWWVIATPACDLVKRADGKAKADYVRLLRAQPLGGTGMRPKDVATGGKPRYMYMAPHGPVPELVIDMQHVRTEPYAWWAESSSVEVVATLDMPYAESLVVRYGQYAGRVGVPDVDLDRIER